MLIGHEGVATALTTRLRERGEPTARLVEELQGLNPGEITVPAHEDIHPVWTNVVSKGRFPTWMVLCRDSPIRRTVGEGNIHPNLDELEWRYPMSVVTDVTGPHDRATALLRYRLMLVVRVILLQDRVLVPERDGSKAVLETQDMNEVVNGESYNSETTEYLMEGVTEFHVRSVESMPTIRGPLGQAFTLTHRERKLDQ